MGFNAMAQLTTSSGSNMVAVLDSNIENAGATFSPYTIALWGIGIALGLLGWFLRKGRVRA